MTKEIFYHSIVIVPLGWLLYFGVFCFRNKARFFSKRWPIWNNMTEATKNFEPAAPVFRRNMTSRLRRKIPSGCGGARAFRTEKESVWWELIVYNLLFFLHYVGIWGCSPRKWSATWPMCYRRAAYSGRHRHRFFPDVFGVLLFWCLFWMRFHDGCCAKRFGTGVWYCVMPKRRKRWSAYMILW